MPGLKPLMVLTLPRHALGTTIYATTVSAHSPLHADVHYLRVVMDLPMGYTSSDPTLIRVCVKRCDSRQS
jgi:hypothetical protein